MDFGAIIHLLVVCTVTVSSLYPLQASVTAKTNRAQGLSMNILVWGTTGWIGGQLIPLLEKVGTVIPARARLQDVAAVTKELDEVNPDRVVLCAGITGRPNVDWCEDNQAVTHDVNFYGTVALVRACSDRGIHITNFATGCIFQYDELHPVGGLSYTESDEPNFFGSVYSRTKGAAEMATRDLPHHLLLRVRMPITCDGASRCFVTKIANYRKVVSVPNSVSVLPDLLPLAVELMAARDEGVYNLVSPGPVAHADILDAYTGTVDPLFTYNTMGMAEHNTVVKAGRSNNSLDSSKLQARFPDRRIPPAVESVRGLLLANQPALRGQFIPKSMLVTGGAGFIGSGFVKFIKSSLHNVPIVVLDKMNECASMANLEGVHDIQVVVGDIMDKDLVVSTLKAHNVDTIVHFAAQTHVDASFDNSLSFTYANVVGTHTLLQAAVEVGTVQRFVHMSTDEVYGETLSTEGVKEDTYLQPTNPYAASKVGAEAMVQAYRKSFGLNTVIIRSNNVYGPGQYPEKVIPRFLLRNALGLPLQVQGTGLQVRNFLYVLDVARAVAVVASLGKVGHVYNIASKDEYTVLDLANAIQGGTADTLIVPDRPFNDCRYWVNDDSIRELGWEQKVSFEEGLQRTQVWYNSHLPHMAEIWPTWEVAVHALNFK